MDNKSHKIVGIFTTLQDTDAARNFLIERGIAQAHINLITPDDTMTDKKIEPDGDGVAKEVVKDAIIGGAIVPPCYGLLARGVGNQMAYLVLVPMYAVMVAYALFAQRRANALPALAGVRS